MGRYWLHAGSAACASAFMLLAGCHGPSDRGAISGDSPPPPVIDASRLTTSNDEQSIPPDHAGILHTDWPNVSASRFAAMSKAVFDIDDGQHNRVTVTHLGAEGTALGLGDSVTAEAEALSRALSTAEFTVNYAKRRMTSLAAQANPANRAKIIDLAIGLGSDLKQFGVDATSGGSSAR